MKISKQEKKETAKEYNEARILLGSELSRIRGAKELQQKEIAKKMSISDSYINLVVKGENHPSFDFIKKYLSAALDISEEELMNKIDNPQNADDKYLGQIIIFWFLSEKENALNLIKSKGPIKLIEQLYEWNVLAVLDLVPREKIVPDPQDAKTLSPFSDIEKSMISLKSEIINLLKQLGPQMDFEIRETKKSPENPEPNRKS